MLTFHAAGDWLVGAGLRPDANVAAGETARLVFNLDKAVFFDPTSGQRVA